MATTTCGKCGGHSFQLVEVKIVGANYRHNTIQCSSCVVPIPTTTMYNQDWLLGEIAKKLGVHVG